MRPSRPSLLHPGRVLAALAVLIALALAPALGAAAQDDVEDPNLDQTIERDQPVVDGPAVLGAGHVDVGPRFIDDDFTLLVHDDTEVPSVWRSLEETVMSVGDAALQVVPDDPTYDFLGVEAGTEVHIVPQVERPGVVWVGWNTQDPEVTEVLDRGATLTLLGVQGPGELTVFLQSGALGDPEVLWRSVEAERQSIWVEVNTHTHANWVFTEPGVYLVQVEIAAERVGGEPVTDVQTLRFAVGEGTSTDEALAAEYTQAVPIPEAEADDASGTGGDAEAGGDGDGGGPSPIAIALVAAAVVLLALVALVAVRGGRAKRRAEQERTGGPASGAEVAAALGAEDAPAPEDDER